MAQDVSYRTIQVDGLSIFYREAGPKDAPTLLLLHGLPSSSRMFEPLLTRLAEQLHLVAPDYPGLRAQRCADPTEFAYTFDHIAERDDALHRGARALTATRSTCRTTADRSGFRMALAHPERVDGADRAGRRRRTTKASARTGRRGARSGPIAPPTKRRCGRNLLSLETTRTRHVGSDPNPEKYDPDLWTDEYAFLNKPGQADIQSDLFYDYRTNVDAYPKWQAWLQSTQPRLLVLWGKYDLSFEPTEPEAYRRDVPKAEVHVLDAGHFALDTAADEIAELVGASQPPRRSRSTP